ncbi:MAG: hypothetical protein K0R54_1860 [Clostridiaceae bacterium]|jgi:hypothetical protein|nr:hypothetical protein [Clostridiaceae bacterium]
MAYPDSKNYKFKKFDIEIKSEERKTIHGRYYLKQKKIEIFNLSRPTNHIITTAIHEVSHHIDCMIRYDSDHTKEFYEIMHLLLINAIGMGIISKKDIIAVSDNADKFRLEKYFGDINNWKVPLLSYKNNELAVKVRNCYKIKDKLKERGYRYSPLEQSWEKIINMDMENEEKAFLSKIIDMENVSICSANEIDIKAVYYITLLNADKYENYLGALKYYKNGYGINNHLWNKKIMANNLEKELALVKDLPGVKVKIKGIK